MPTTMSIFVSYAQNFEDVMLWRALGHVERGCYVDIGAMHPSTLSTSLAFYERGWRGIHVEPIAEYAELLRNGRPDEIVLQVAVGEREGVVTIHEIAGTGLSTLDPAIAEGHVRAGWRAAQRTVPAVTLDAILAKCEGREVHWLKIDVEGYERQVLTGWTLAAPLPWIVIVESTAPLTRIDTSAQWESILLAKGYRFAYFDGLNRFYVAKGRKALLAAFREPPNVFDNFSLTASSTFSQGLAAEIFTLRDGIAQREAALTDVRRRELEAANQLRAAREQSEALRRQQTESHARLHDVTQALTVAQADAQQGREASVMLAAELETERANRKRSEESLETIVARRATLEKELTRQRVEFDGLVQQLSEQHRSHEALAADLLATQTRVGDLARDLTESHANVLHLRQACTDAERRAGHTTQSLVVVSAAYESIRNSRSWRMTAPLRELFGFARRLGALLRGGPGEIARVPKRAARRVLLAALTRLRAHPERKRRLAGVLRHSGWIDARLRRFAAANPAVAVRVPPPRAADSTENELTPGATIPPVAEPAIPPGATASDRLTDALRGSLAQWPLGSRRNV